MHFAVGIWEKASEIWWTQAKIVHELYLSHHFERETLGSYFISFIVIA